MVSSYRWIAFVMLAVSPALASAQLRFATPSADLGELRGGAPAQHRFDFVNDSTTPIVIVDIRLGCGCLLPVLEKRIYQPAERGTLILNIRTLGQPEGIRSWQAFVQYRAGDTLKEAALVVAAKIRNEVTVEPSIIAMSVETTLRQEVTFTDHRPRASKVVAVRASSPAIRVSTQPMGNGVTKFILDVSQSALTATRQDETLSIYTDDPNYRQLDVPIRLTKAERAQVTATPAKVGITGAGSQLVRLRGANDQVVRIRKVEADHAAIKCTWAAGPGVDATLKICVDATAPVSSEVRVHLAEPAGVTLIIPLQATKE